jgi:hypothetical protein
MNATSHMQSLERTFTLMPLAPLTTTHQSNESENHA